MSDQIIILKKILSDLNNPKIILSSELRRVFIRETEKTAGFYDFSMWLEAFEYLKVIKGSTKKKTFEPDYKRLAKYEPND